MTGTQLFSRIGQVIASLNKADEILSVTDLRMIDLVWHELIYEGKGDSCQHPDYDVMRGFCYSCGRKVE